MNVFEKSQKYSESLQKMWAEAGELKGKIAEARALAQKSLENGDSTGFFEHSRKRAVLEKKLEEIESIPCNATGVSPDEIAAEWAKHKEAGVYRKELEVLCATRNAYIEQIRKFRRAYKNEVDAVDRFHLLAASSGCGKELLQDMKRPRGIRWDLVERCADRGFFMLDHWCVDTVYTLTPEQIEM